MQTLIALLMAAVAACAIAHPPDSTESPASLLGQELQLMHEPPKPLPPREPLGDYLLPRMLLPDYMSYVESSMVVPLMPDNDWLNQEIDHINQMSEEIELMSPYEANLLRWYSQNIYLRNMLKNPMNIQEPENTPDSMQAIIEETKPIPMVEPELLWKMGNSILDTKRGQPEQKDISSHEKTKFALTPMNERYYAPVPKHKQTSNKSHQTSHKVSAEPPTAMLLEIPRQTRQNPNLRKQKHLLESEMGKLKTGLSYEHEKGEANNQHYAHPMDPATDLAESIFSVALLAAVAVALTMAIVGFAFGWYTLAKRTKAAADVDYPAYGVTGPNMDSSGDRQLAQSAHMYHYQHQKQQIIAMERNGLEQRAGSMSDPESEEENEEGDYTVYECPGFATTGDMEVKNPLFSEDPTPVAPGRCEMVNQQPNA